MIKLIKIKTFENEITKNDMLKQGNTIALILQSNGKSNNNLNDQQNESINYIE